VDGHRKKYTVEELLLYDDASFVTHVFRCLLKRDPDRAALGSVVRALENGDTNRLDFAAETAASPEASRAGILVFGLAAHLRKKDPGPHAAPVDPARLSYTLGELVNVPGEIFIANLYCCIRTPRAPLTSLAAGNLARPPAPTSSTTLRTRRKRQPGAPA
jgi:hypothetical protein